MPRIREYDSQVGAQGAVGTINTQRADASAFGVDIRPMGEALTKLGGMLQEKTETQEVTKAHIEIMRAKELWDQNLAERTNSAQPGDDNFVPKLTGDIQNYLTTGSEAFKTERGRQTWAALGASMREQYVGKGVVIQANLAAKAAENDYGTMMTTLSSRAKGDWGNKDSIYGEGVALIDDPKGMFARVPQTTRDQMRLQLQKDVEFAAAQGFVRANPEGWLGSMSPEDLKRFNTSQKVINQTVVPGGSPQFSKGAMQWADKVQTTAAASGLNANILLAQLDKESRGNANAVGAKGEIGLTQFMPATATRFGVKAGDVDSQIAGQAKYMAFLLDRYKGNYEKALAAYNWGEGNVDRAGEAWQSKLPSSTRAYVSEIMAKSGMVNVGAPPPEQPVSSVSQPVAQKLPFKLDGKQQEQITHEAVQVMHLKLSMEDRTRREADRAKKEAEEATQNELQRRIYSPRENEKPPTDAEIWENNVLTPQQKQHLSDLLINRPRQLEQKSNPVEFGNLYRQIVADSDNPQRTFNTDAINESLRNGKINPHEHAWLSAQVSQLKDPNGNSFAKQVAQINEQTRSSLNRTIQGQIDPIAANDAAYRFTMDFQRAIEEKRKKNEDPRALLDPNSKEYFPSPQRIMSYMRPTGTALAVSADKVVQEQKSTLPTWQEYDKLASGATYTDPQGNIRKKK